MLEKKLTIVPVTLDPITDEPSSVNLPQNPSGTHCVIKTETLEISFFNGVDERNI
ncbi:hypothetical protein [Robertmurraya massiliosenegalensis]|uniref:hypothetical protein n=1 Tax=Robertmurraya massiliosenegalensis TaxID=1287657 RepID=UPI000381A72A|nr:hypothetical protein [Robertmurraya massiliosenegalensis]